MAFYVGRDSPRKDARCVDDTGCFCHRPSRPIVSKLCKKPHCKISFCSGGFFLPPSLSHYDPPKCYNPNQICTRSPHAIHNTHSNRRNRSNTSRIQGKANKSKNVSRYDRSSSPIKSKISWIY